MGIWAKGIELLLASFQPPLGQGASCAAIMICKFTGPRLARTLKEVPTKLPPSQLPFQTHTLCNAKTHSMQCTHTPCNATTHSVQCNYTLRAMHTQTLRAMQLHTPCNAHTNPPCNATTHSVQCNYTPCNATTLHAMQLHTPCNATTHSMQCNYTLRSMHTPSVQCKKTLCAMQLHPPCNAYTHTPCNATTHSVQCTHTPCNATTPSVQCNNTLRAMQLHPPCNAHTPSMQCTHAPCNATANLSCNAMHLQPVQRRALQHTNCNAGTQRCFLPLAYCKRGARYIPRSEVTTERT
ncbi:Hypothetical predicted protein [Podarcis lilfordi]|uniref:Uncharacterized protein n=1 Tax=Podarcis lilfordi TaxID=74358 RepID=A0AA35NWJ2_9SAUR|nr:Hypothetical predicted protein [Podarcis lilfordi]